jgi:hypothetical protein
VNPWESGSEYHLASFEPQRTDWPWGDDGVGYGSGRDALRGLLRHGRSERGWRRLWVPTFFCQDVVAALLDEGLQVVSYRHLPGERVVLPEGLGPGDVALVCNTFGLMNQPDDWPVDVIEDHSHDLLSPWALQSRAAFALASLRKSLPVPDGGVVWSPRGEGLPPQPSLTEERDLASSHKLAGMVLKGIFVAGGAVEKEVFRKVLAAGEARIASGEVSSWTTTTEQLLRAIPGWEWRRRRRGNLAALVEHLEGRVECFSTGVPEAVAFSAVLVLASRAQRDAVRSALITGRIYPAILWALDEPARPLDHPEAKDLAERVLSVHVDHRYDADDMTRIASVVLHALEAS